MGKRAFETSGLAWDLDNGEFGVIRPDRGIWGCWPLNFRNLRNFHRGTLNFRGTNISVFGIRLRLEISIPSVKIAKLAKVFGLAPAPANLELNFWYPLLMLFPPHDFPRLSAEDLANLRTSLDAAEMPV